MSNPINSLIREVKDRLNTIYHNQVDARGDKPASENEVFNAFAEAISEIFDLIKSLTDAVSATRFIVTADHGFLSRLILSFYPTAS